MGDYLRPLGMRTALVGKTHMEADVEGMERLGIDPESIIGVRVAECGFEPYERDDGLHGVGPDGALSIRGGRATTAISTTRAMTARTRGTTGPMPPTATATRLASGWAMRHARKPARVREEDSETPYMTRRGIDFIREAGDDAVVPASVLHQAALALHRAGALQRPCMGADDVIPAVRSRERAPRSASGLSRVHGAPTSARRSRATRCAPKSSRSTWA